MKCVVADLVTCTHGENRLARCLKRQAVAVAMSKSPGFAFFVSRRDGSEVRDESLPHSLGARRSVRLELRKTSLQRAFTRRPDLASYRVIVSQIEGAEQRPKSESL